MTTPKDHQKILHEVHHDDVLWKAYVDRAETFDNHLVDEWNKTLDVILVFAALFISVLATFLGNGNSSDQSQPDPVHTSNQVLLAIYQHLTQSNHTIIDTDTLFSQTLANDSAAIQNALLYSSLALSTVLSTIALAAKLWVVSYSHNVSSIGSYYDRAIRRQRAYSGVLVWKMEAVIGTLPLMLLVAVVMFGFYIHYSIFAIQASIGYIVGTILGLGLVMLCVPSLAAAFIPACPFQSPFSDILRLTFQTPKTLSMWIFRNVYKKKMYSLEKIPGWLRTAAFLLIFAVSGVAIAYAILALSGSFAPIVCVPVAFTFAFSMQQPKKPNHTPQRHKLPQLSLLVFFVIGTSLSAAGYVRDQHQTHVFIILYVIGMSFLLFFGWMASGMSKSVDETEIDATAWLLKSTPFQDPDFLRSLEKTTKLASVDPRYRPRVLESLVSLLPPLIASYETDSLHEHSQHENSLDEDQLDAKSRQERLRLQDLLSCLATLSNFEDDHGTFWLLKEDRKSHPTLENKARDKLRLKLMQLAQRADAEHRVPATQILKNFKLNDEENLQEKERVLGDAESAITLTELYSPYEGVPQSGHDKPDNGYHSLA